MAGYKTKVRHWQDAGLITPAQADAIFAWEQDRKAGKFGRGLVGLGLFAILMGVLSIIAANWYAIPAAVKIGAHFLLNTGVAVVAWRAAAQGKDIIREGAALAFFALTLTFMVLIGQVYQLDGTLTGLATTWMVITLPFMWFFAHRPLSGIPWMIAFLATITAAMSENLHTLPQYWQMFFITAVATLLPLGLMADGSLRVFQRLKPAYAQIFVRTGVALLALNATMASFYWLAPRHMDIAQDAAAAGLSYTTGYLYLIAIFAVALAGIALRAVFGRYFVDDAARKMATLFSVASVMMIALPLLLPGGASSIAAAIFFIAYWIFIGWIGQQLAWSRLISLAIVLVAIRIFAIYLEVFGNLLSTGVGLVVGGAVLLGLISLARRMNKRLAGTVAPHG